MNAFEQALNQKVESDRQLGIYLDNALAGVGEVATHTVEMIELGFDRSVKHLSYFFDDEKYINAEVLEENNRFFSAWWLYKQGRDPIKEMIDVFIDQCTAGIDEREMSYLHEKITSTLKFGSGFASKRVTKMAINAAISEAIYSLILTKEIMKPISRGVGNVAMFGLGSYGIIEKAAQAKERLRMQSPIYYWSLYFMKIEMLYFIVEDNLSCGLHLISQYKNKVNDVYDAFMKILYG